MSCESRVAMSCAPIGTKDDSTGLQGPNKRPPDWPGCANVSALAASWPPRSEVVA